VAILNITRGGEVTTADAGTVVCPKDGSKPYVERTDPSGIAAEIVATAETYFGRYISDDVRTTVVQTYERANALAGRNTVPYIIYWCPPSDILRRLEKACKACGWGRISIFAGYGSDELSKEACVTAANDGLEAKLRAFSEECSKYAGADPTATRAATIESKIADIKTLRAQWALYRSILGAQVETGDERIAALEDSLRATLGLVEAAHAAA